MKLIMSLLLIVLMPLGLAATNTPYYKKLAQGCKTRGESLSCCMASVNNMQSSNAILAPQNQQCPKNWQFDMLRCHSSYQWCSPPKPLKKP